ncbi:MAG: LysR family transcriptional regulator ArgP [Paracoccaceae bacterium]
MEYHYESLTALAAVVREGGFDAAAKSLKVTQSAVSQRIRQLEEKVGALLIVRGRPCLPTELGSQLCHHLEQVLLLQHELNGRIDGMLDSHNSSGATVKIAVNSDSLATWFPSVVKRAMKDLKLQLEITPDDQDHTEESLRSGDALAVVTSIERPVQGCRRISLGAMEYVAIASPEFYKSFLNDGVSLQTLTHAPLIIFDRKDSLPQQWMESCFDESIWPPTTIMPSYEGYLECCLNGVGWGMMPISSVAKQIESGELVDLMPGKIIKISLHWQSGTQSSKIMQRLGEIVTEEAMVHLVTDSYRTL